MIRFDNISAFYDDIIIVPTQIFDQYDARFLKFALDFETLKCQSPADVESDLIFTYRTDKYTYISKKLLYDTQTAIEDFATWGQYGNITQYFWGLPVDSKILARYNRMMTYKIADLLLQNGYIVPMETIHSISIPRIEISNYADDKVLTKQLGDIDSMFFSEQTRTLYLIEYKNYQMLVSREGDLKAELSKVSRENTPSKVLERQKYVTGHIENCIDILFQNRFNAQDVAVRSIILTTKPCYYFYVNEAQDYDYMDWVEFERKVLDNEL